MFSLKCFERGEFVHFAAKFPHKRSKKEENKKDMKRKDKSHKF